METRGIEDMFDFRRFPKDAVALLLLLIYSPVGICLMLMRIFIGVHVFLVSCAIPESIVRRFVVRIMCSVLGMHVRQRNPRSRDKNTKLYICNHVTEFDHNIINLLTPFNTVSVQFSLVTLICCLRCIGLLHKPETSARITPSCTDVSTNPHVFSIFGFHGIRPSFKVLRNSFSRLS
ncbi:Ancient ubiquitous protein 1 [Ilyodon furcidens]|uniref:Ancient ubiquitous protein 1 n=1 Tax=Ilyodon furcidens TaxID=33524 RepID=A0ABV0VAC9_9TELE